MFHPRAFIVSGPSGVGKSTIIHRVLEFERNIRLSVSLTTRPKRAGEVEGMDYYFVSKHAFEEMIRQGEFMEWAKVYDNYYGSSRSHVEGILANNHHALLDLDTQGALEIKRSFTGAVLIFIQPPDLSTLQARLRNRGSESDESLAKRLAWAEHEMSFSDQYDYVITNTYVDEAARALVHIINKERTKAVTFSRVGGPEDIVVNQATEKAVRYALERINQEALVRTLGEEVKHALRGELEVLIRERLATVLGRDLDRIVEETYRVFSNR